MVPHVLEFLYTKGGEESRAAALARMSSVRKNTPGFTLLDVGSIDDPWTDSLATATMDLKSSRADENAGRLHFQGNINDPEVWRQALGHVEQHGKFSFSVCAHTLEDIAYPSLALRMLPLVSEAGLLSMPSHMRELSRGIEGPWRGYIHHRWMYRERNGELLLVPKVPFVEHAPLPSDCPAEMVELQAWWRGTLTFKVLNDDYLGPNKKCVQDMYQEALSC